MLRALSSLSQLYFLRNPWSLAWRRGSRPAKSQGKERLRLGNVPSTETVFPRGRRAAPSFFSLCVSSCRPLPFTLLPRINSRAQYYWGSVTCPRLWRSSDRPWSQNQVQGPYLWFPARKFFPLQDQILSISSPRTQILETAGVETMSKYGEADIH